jgi:citrate synthase
MSERRYLSAWEAAEELGVSVRTLYAYVSRGLVRSEPGEGRKRRYRAEDVRALKRRREARRDPERAVEGALGWGIPVMESGITLISGGRLYYRGRDAVGLARRATFEEVAALIWRGDGALAAEVFAGTDSGLPGRLRAVRERVGHLAPLEVFQVLLPVAASEDLAAYDLRPEAVARTGARILRTMAAAAGEGRGADGVAGTLRLGWCIEDERLLEAALILCADHELPVSTFAARCVGSAEATPYSVVLAGLSALQGRRHGGALDLVEVFLKEVEDAGDARTAIARRLRRGDVVPGFGHVLYPEGDPRGAEILRLLRERLPGSDAVSFAEEVAEAALEVIGERPTLDFGLVALARAFGLPPGGAVALFAIGRTAGWIGHAIEQYASGSLIRPRARYTGEVPGTDA